ncbi:MAG: S26 family signal peptidase [Candidatus Methanoplasma sp.]|jgi:signal peptidase|nr:S26 family signal peptidase [Candidatus Methanoplasma sp.]
MQHGMESQIGVIDTGDMIILKDKSKVNIQTYVDGYKTGYKKFGDFGDVIIYERSGNIPVIHRAMLWLEYNSNETWSAPSLEGYPEELWSCTSGDHNNLYGILMLNGQEINLDNITRTSPYSGYLTKGDNNVSFDQPSNIPGVYGLISYDKIQSVAWFEVPWVGAFKMMLEGKSNTLSYWVPNTIPNISAAVILLVFMLVGIGFLFDYRYYENIREELAEEMDAPAPLFLVETEDRSE